MSQHTDKYLEEIESELNLPRRHTRNILTKDFDAMDEAGISIASAMHPLGDCRLKVARPHEKATGIERLAA